MTTANGTSVGKGADAGSVPTSTRSAANAKPIFDGVVFFLDSELAPETVSTLKALLEKEGGVAWEDTGKEIPADYPMSYRFDPLHTTHVITTTLNFPEYASCIDPQADGIWDSEKLKEKAVCASPEWVRRSYTLGERQPERFYSTDPARIFSGKILHASRLSKPEMELLYGAVQSLGGGYKLSLTKEVTHLVTPVEDSTKLLVLRVGRDIEDAGIIAVHPSWVNESIKYNSLVDYTPFAWPLDAPGKPPVLVNTIREPPFYAQNEKKGGKAHGNAASANGDRLPPADVIASIHGSKELFTPQHTEEQHLAGGDSAENAAQTGEKDKRGASKSSLSKKLFKHPYAFQGKRILYAVKHPSSDSDTTHGMRGLDMLAYKVKAHGGEWVPPPFAEQSIETAVMQADVVITSYRDEPAACYAFWHGKQLATINWVWSVMTSGRLVSSLDNVLHFPPPSGSIPGFDKFVITVSNYTGENRSYLKNLITQMGARWTPDMSSANTLCVSCSLTGQKVTKASEWQIPIVNHFWLEDCFVRWQVLKRSEAAYRDFAPGVNLQKIVGGTHLDTDLLKPWAKQAEEYTKRMGRQARAGANFYGVSSGEGRASTRSSQARKAQLEEQEMADATKIAEEEAAMQRVVDETVMPDKTIDLADTTTTKSRKVSGAAAKKAPRKKAQKAPQAPQEQPQEQPQEEQQADEEMEIEAAVELEEEPEQPKSKKQAKGKANAADKPASHKKKRGRESEESAAGSKAGNTSQAGSVTASAKKKPKTAAATTRRYYATTMAESITATVSKNFRAALGWELVDSITDECEVVVAGKLNRSEKTLCAILRGIDIVTEDWVFESITAEKTLDLSDFPLRDKQEEKARGFTLTQALEKSRKRKKPLFEGHSFFFTKNMKPDPNILRRIVTLGGGEALNSDPDSEYLIESPERFHLISSEQDKKIYMQMRADRDVHGQLVKVWSGELILKAVLNQEIDWKKDLLLPK